VWPEGKCMSLYNTTNEWACNEKSNSYSDNCCCERKRTVGLKVIGPYRAKITSFGPSYNSRGHSTSARHQLGESRTLGYNVAGYCNKNHMLSILLSFLF